MANQWSTTPPITGVTRELHLFEFAFLIESLALQLSGGCSHTISSTSGIPSRLIAFLFVLALKFVIYNLSLIYATGLFKDVS